MVEPWYVPRDEEVEEEETYRKNNSSSEPSSRLNLTTMAMIEE